ncbi:MAG TPA: protein translocase subunit SecF [bacterium]|jgi:preprotein translocase subunit SecF|nr:MAG: preprotein translocase subunit SecF [Parcubacteria group bacterium ADurb.Bin115]HNU81313.1 protein translocase subunit SecF [bacterium]HOD86766.1 protein translocase subunit SecF [bacterium]HPW05461.1 protein translocase subunit SecF [bacterium]HPY99566.1 protein translocase subunit SecF [bacterium]
MNLQIIKHRNLWLSLSGIMVVASIIFISLWGLKFGLDFTGGSLLEVKFTSGQPSVSTVQAGLNDTQVSSLIIQPTEDSMILRFQESDEDTHQAVVNALRQLPEAQAGLEEVRFEAIGPSIGQELRSKAFWLMFFVLIVIIIYIGLAFQRVSKPVASWKYGLTAIIALFHDLLITIGVFSLLGHFYGVEINTTFVVALLTVLGYSVNDTIVVFDRTRENLPKSTGSFAETVNSSLNQTLVRSINTVITTLLALLAVLFFGGDSIREFVLALIIGIFCGAYSSIFVVSPLLVVWQRLQKR